MREFTGNQSDCECHKSYLVVPVDGRSEDAVVNAADESEAIATYKHAMKLGEGGDYVAEEYIKPVKEKPSDANRPGKPDNAKGRDLHGTGGADDSKAGRGTQHK